MRIKMKLLHKVFLFSIGLVSLVIIGVVYLSNNFLENYYLDKRIEQIKEVREILSKTTPTEEEIETYAKKYNLAITLKSPKSKRMSRYKEFDENNEGSMVSVSMGMEHLEYYKLLPNGELLSIAISIDSIKSTVGIINSFFIYAGIVILLGSLFFVYIFSLQITKPITDLNNIIKKMVNMDFSHRANFKTGDELEELGKSINFLAFELENNIGKLKLSNKKLSKEIEKRKQIDELRKEFIASVTHEIKTPVTVINTHAEMLLYDLVENEEERKEYLKIIMSEGDNISGLLSELVKLIKLEENITDIKKENLELSNILEEEVNKYKIDLGEKNINLEMNLIEGLIAIGDSFKIRQVITNIMSNAVSYVNNNGKIIINLLNLEDKVKVEIINTGSKIPEEKKENIWKAFYRVEQSRNRKYGGLGLGLKIVSEILERHNSEFGVENTNNGVKFWFTLDLGGKNEMARDI